MAEVTLVMPSYRSRHNKPLLARRTANLMAFFITMTKYAPFQISDIRQARQCLD